MAHVLDHSNHHQVYTDFKFIGKCNYIKLPPQDLWDNTSLQNNSLLFLALQSLADGKPLPQLLSVFSVLRLTYPIPYTCKSLFTIQPQIPQYNGSQRLRKAYNVARGLARYNLQRTQRSHMYIYIYLYTLHDFGHAQHFRKKFNVRNEFQKVQKWNCHDQCFSLTFEQRQATKMAAQPTECVRCVRVTTAHTDTCWSN